MGLWHLIGYLALDDVGNIKKDVGMFILWNGTGFLVGIFMGMYGAGEYCKKCLTKLRHTK